MAEFDYAFSLFGLLLGLALAEALGGLVRAIDTRGRLRIGWLTPLMSLVVALDVVSFWSLVWGVRGSIHVSYLVLTVGGLLAGTYYVAAALSFPRDPAAWSDLDDFFLARRMTVFSIVAALNIVFTAVAVAAGWWSPNWLGVGMLIAYAQLLMMVAAVAVPRRLALRVMSALLLAYLLGPIVIVLSRR